MIAIPGKVDVIDFLRYYQSVGFLYTHETKMGTNSYEAITEGGG